VLVSLPEEMPVNETLELWKGFTDRLGIRVEGVILNAFTPARFSTHDLEGLAHAPGLLALAKGHVARAELSEDAKRRLDEGTRAPVLTLPRIYHDRFGKGAVDALAQHLRRAGALP
jgi:hypothetical protein